MNSPLTALPQARALGARTVRVTISWYRMAPDPGSTRKPNFDASNPNAYSASGWAAYDALVRQARQQGLTVALQITGGAPRWAEGKDAPAVYRRTPDDGWRPNAALYGQFVHAVAERYDGRYRPSGSTAALPAVRFWSFWNEPNFGTDLGPQTTNGSTVPVAPTLYRSLLNSAWTAMHETGHSHDTLLIGELDPLGNALRVVGHPGPLPGATRVTAPLSFIRALYCVDPDGHRLTGASAARYSCPSTAAASRKFRAQNPALFTATGFGIHPYSFEQAPNTSPSKVNNNYTTFPVLSRLTEALDRGTKAYGSGKRFQIYNDEFGYITRPPSGAGFPSQATASTWLNETEYLSYKNRRVASYDQYLINDPMPTRVQSDARVQHWPVHGVGSAEGDAVGVPSAGVAAGAHDQGGRPDGGLGRRSAGDLRSDRVTDPGDPDAEGRARRLDDDPDRARFEDNGLLRHPPETALQRQPAAGLHLPADPSRFCRRTSLGRRSTAGPSRSRSAVERRRRPRTPVAIGGFVRSYRTNPPLVGAGQVYIASIDSAYLDPIGLRLSFIVGVSSSPPGNQSPLTIVNFLICSTRARCELARSTPC